jgi:hypothetical protein
MPADAIRVATLNVRSLCAVGRAMAVAEVMMEKGVTIANLQEVSWDENKQTWPMPEGWGGFQLPVGKQRLGRGLAMADLSPEHTAAAEAPFGWDLWTTGHPAGAAGG